MKNIKLIVGIILIFLASAFVLAAEECEKMEATFSWTVQEEEFASTVTVTSNDVGEVMIGCSMFEVEEFSGSKLVLVYPQDEDITAVITSSDVGEKPTYDDEFGSNTICDLKLIEFDRNKHSATFGVPEYVDKIKNKTVTSDDVDVEFELTNCKVKVMEFDINSGKLVIGIDDKCSGNYQEDWILKSLTDDDVGNDIFFQCCKWKLENFGCIVEEIEEKIELNIQDEEEKEEKENDTLTEDYKKNSDIITDEKIEIDNEETNNTKIMLKEQQENQIINHSENLIHNKNSNLCDNFDVGGICIPAFAVIALIIAILFVVVFLFLMIFSLIKK